MTRKQTLCPIIPNNTPRIIRFLTKSFSTIKDCKFSTAWLRITVTVVVAILAQRAFAQTENQLLTIATWGFGSLNAEQQGKVTSLQQRPGVASIQYVDVDNLANIQQDGWLDLTIPGKDCTARVKAKHIESFDNGDYYWYGTIVKGDGTTEEACSCYDGTINLLSADGRISGTLKVDEDLYELHDLGNNKRLLVKKDYTGLQMRCANDGSEGFQEPENGVNDRTEGNCAVKVLALYTPAARAALPDINSTINLTINQTNQAFRNSQVMASDLTLVLVGRDTVSFVETPFMRDDLDTLIIKSELQAKRNAADADIVLVFAQGDYGTNLGRAGTLTLQSERAVSLINATDALNGFTASHEIGHLFACRHESEADPTGLFEHAHCFKTGCWPFRKERRTIMYSTRDDPKTIQHYSNPNVEYKSKKTGVTDERENWRQLRANACTVATFRNQSIPALQAYISGSGFGCPCENIGMGAIVSGGAPGSYTFQWQKSNDGFNWGGVLSTASSFSVALPCEEGEGVYVRLTVMSADSQIVQKFRFFEAAMTWPGQEQICFERSTSGTGPSVASILVSPNPTNNSFSIRCDIDITSEVQIDIFDNIGRLVISNIEIAAPGNFEKNVNVYHLVRGLHLLRLTINGQETIHKIVKQ